VQRSIAEFLDAETTRIDELVAKKHNLVDLLYERRWQLLEEQLHRRGISLPTSLNDEAFNKSTILPGWRIIPLSRCVDQLTNGYVGPTRDILQEEGVRYVQSLHLKRGRIDFNRRPYYVSPDWHFSRPRIALREGDILIVQTGDIGQVAVVPKNFGPASCHALLIARVRRDVVTSDYLGTYLKSRFGYHSLVRLATGALHPHLEFGIRAAHIVIPPVEEQRAIAVEVQQAEEVIDTAIDRLTQQMALLQERRQALIAAAVIGRLTIPGLAA
jgi:type I restriction enzyme, S subunit